MHIACMRGANRKHPRHACDAGRVEVQRLVERRRGGPGALYALVRVRIIGLGLVFWFMVRVGGGWARVRVVEFRSGYQKSKRGGEMLIAHTGQDTHTGGHVLRSRCSVRTANM